MTATRNDNAIDDQPVPDEVPPDGAAETATGTGKAGTVTATATATGIDTGVETEDQFALDVRVIEDVQAVSGPGRCDTSNGCAPTCASACTNSAT